MLHVGAQPFQQTLKIRSGNGSCQKSQLLFVSLVYKVQRCTFCILLIPTAKGELMSGHFFSLMRGKRKSLMVQETVSYKFICSPSMFSNDSSSSEDEMVTKRNTTKRGNSYWPLQNYFIPTATPHFTPTHYFISPLPGLAANSLVFVFLKFSSTIQYLDFLHCI